MKTLIVYYSFTGNNQALCGRLQRLLNCDSYRIMDVKRRTWFTILLDLLFNRMPKIQEGAPDIGKFEKIILLAPVWNAHVAAPMKSFIKREKVNLPAYAFMTVCGGRPGQEAKLRQELTKLAGKAPEGLLELEISKLPPGKNLQPKNNTLYRIQEPDLDQWNADITGFIRSLQGVPA